jgi:hypothetical protein
MAWGNGQWAWGNGQWAFLKGERGQGDKGNKKKFQNFTWTMPDARCPMPDARCPMPDAPFSIVNI